jgi:hypothetical protein
MRYDEGIGSNAPHSPLPPFHHLLSSFSSSFVLFILNLNSNASVYFFLTTLLLLISTTTTAIIIYKVVTFAKAIASHPKVQGMYGLAAVHAHSCCTLLAKKDIYFTGTEDNATPRWRWGISASPLIFPYFSLFSSSSSSSFIFI